ncbi:hypothetical protein KIY80_gp43 [Mycobacterium phage Benvolio]|uniref:Uncharacterized protein n=1 Tax=Mycobacterium phage Benvolio TaxID=2591074 RepID=A0A514A3N2_9CAUD|nr:hypothetical protein CH13_gp046 [Mycobacterium phage Echild]YP_010063480.1 hypothetical protein KIY80_gp43 [Mycobacterium phage Benvolio]AHG24267.1 hypothetical protein PBI_ECHILD_46 [Mycobacterium phage Echild]QDH47861.1 hypothetical protein SEA_BENVOLIO_43 [Mycobacterium phage Benvolio]
MKIGLTTHGQGIDGKTLRPGQAALILEGPEKKILAILNAAIEIRDRHDDPVLEALRQSLGVQ